MRQYTDRLVRFVGYLLHTNEKGNLLMIQMDQHQELIGSEHHFLTLQRNYYMYGEESRVKHLWDSNTTWGIQLHVYGA